ncbi:hypothetical protein MRX96_006340 [Rhipicephalus microplus]
MLPNSRPWWPIRVFGGEVSHVLEKVAIDVREKLAKFFMNEGQVPVARTHRHSGRFSSKELYNTAVEQLIQNYPHLRDNIKKGTSTESWKLALKNKFKNNQKKTQNLSGEMEAMRTLNAPKRTRVPGPEEIYQLWWLSLELVVYGETAEERRRHHEWLTENASTDGDDEVRPRRLLVTAKERHELLEHITIQRALLKYLFLATEHSLQLECDLLLKKTSWTT